ncbi:MAG: DUF4173 domain-containing protein [Clostridium sp.]|nr:DUF4173 domain-containing protein [Clostridium sp.]
MDDNLIFYEIRDDETESEKSVLRFNVLGLPTIIYAIVYGICLYKNLTGIMTPVFTIATVVYLWFVLPRLSEDMTLGKEKTKRLIPYFAGIILLGISVFMTSDIFLIVCNYCGIMLLTMAALIRFFCDEAGWSVVKYLLAMLEAMLVPLVQFHMFFYDRKRYREAGNHTIKINKNVKYVAIGIICVIPVFLVVVLNLAYADVIFDKVIDHSFFNFFGKVFDNTSITWDFIGCIILIFCVLLLVYGLMGRLSVRRVAQYELPDKKLNSVIGITFCGVLTTVYLLFSGIQILSLFMRERMLPEGYSYSSYAREGFNQILFVAALNLLIVFVCNTIFAKHQALKIVLTIMCGCTYIMIASSASRLFMYIIAYHRLTYLRVLALFMLLLIAALLTGVIVSIYKPDFKLMRYFIAVTSVLYITLSFAHPDYMIAKYNISRINIHTVQSYDFDLQYLVNNMSCDAAPAMYALAEEVYESEASEHTQYDRYLYSYFHDVSHEYGIFDGVRAFNLSRYRAHLYAERYTD